MSDGRPGQLSRKLVLQIALVVGLLSLNRWFIVFVLATPIIKLS